jgi:DNA-directed RNA polymerase subunit L
MAPPSIKLVEGDATAAKRLVAHMDDVPLPLANALRRVLIAEVPTVAPFFQTPDVPGDVIIHRNTSAMHNEMLAHRVSLIPIHMPTMEDVLKHEPEDITFRLQVKNVGHDNITVTSKDIQAKRASAAKLELLFPADSITGDYPIITLLKPNLKQPDAGEEIDVEFRARRGIGQVHSRYSPVSTCALTLRVDEAEVAARRKELGKDVDANYFDTITTARCFSKGADGEPDKVALVVESECAIPAGRLMLHALDVLLEKLKTLTSKQLQDVRERGDGMYEAVIADEDHTLGNLLQALIFQRMKELSCTYVGYHVPHPLKRTLLLTVAIEGDVPFPSFMERAVASITRTVEETRDAWVKLK